MATAVYKAEREFIESRLCSCTADLTHTLASGTSPTDNGDGTVSLVTSTAHGFLAGSHLYLNGTTNYDGTLELLSLPTASGIRFKRDYKAETFDGTETMSFTVVPGCDFILKEISMHLSAAPDAADIFSCTADAYAGSAWDKVVYTTTMVSGTTTDVSSSSIDKYFFDGDKLVFSFSNTNAKTAGISVVYRRVR
jgi:hypothetical protein